MQTALADEAWADVAPLKSIGLMQKSTQRQLPEKYSALHARMAGLSGIMMRHRMIYAGLHIPDTLSVSDIARHVLFHLEDGTITHGEVQDIIVDCYEHSSKYAYLYITDPSCLAKWTPPNPQAVITDRGLARILPSTGPEQVNYILTNGDCIRISFSELHYDLKPDEVEMSLTKVLRPKVIVVEANRATGHVTLLLDGPASRHIHDNNKKVYFRYWQDRAGAILRCDLQPLSLSGALGHLAGQDIIRIRRTDIVRGDVTFSITTNQLDTVKDCPEYNGLCQTRAAYNKDVYLWVPQPSSNPSKPGVPCRQIKTDISAPAGEIKFMLVSCPANNQH